MRPTLVLLFFTLFYTVGVAQSPAGGGFYLEPVVEDGEINHPTSVAVSPTGELYVAKWLGDVIVVLPNGDVQPEPLVNLYGEVLVNGDRGLVGIELHPDFPTTPYLYLFYPVDDIPGPRPKSRYRAYSRLVRYTVDDTRRAVVPGSRLVLLGATPAEGVVSCYGSHSADSIVFGHDGALYVSHGDGAHFGRADGGGLYPECFEGTGLDPAEDIGAFRSQSLASLSGKVLRLDPETGLGLPDNPFWTGDAADAASRVWALGLRNPFRLAVVPEDPNNLGRTEIIIGDVGAGHFEELDRATGGENFGWPCREGPGDNPLYQEVSAIDGTDCSTPRPGALTAPWAYFSHLDPESSAPAGRVASSITGGAFYRGDSYPERFDGMLFFADFSEGWIAAGRLGPDGLLEPEEVLGDAGSVVDLTYDPATETILVVDIVNERISRLRWAGDAAAPPVARGTVSEPFGEVPHAVQFSDDGSFDPGGGSLTYRWSFGDGGSADGLSASHTYTTPGSYAATLTVTSQAGLVAQSLIRVSAGISLPTIAIDDPTQYVTGPDGRMVLSASSGDPRGEVLDVFWEIDLVHNAHVHPSFGTVDGNSGTVLAESHAGPGEVAFYRARAVVIDQEGLRVESERTIRSYDASEVGVSLQQGAGDPPGEVSAVFSHPVEIGRVSLPAVGKEPSLRLEILNGSGWRPARHLYILPEPGRTQMVFAGEVVRGIRVVGATDLNGPLTLFPRLSPDAEVGEWDPADAGRAEGGRTIAFGEYGLTLASAGSFESGDYHTARQVLSGDGILVAHLDALDGGDDAVAGLAMHTGLSENDSGLIVGKTLGGRVRVWERVGGDVTGSEVAIEGAVWFRIRRRHGLLVAEASRDSLTWVIGGSVNVDAGAALVAGPAVAGGERGAVVWFDHVALLNDAAVPPPSGVVRLGTLFPNPGRGLATFRVHAGVSGTYTAQVVDARGRVVMDLDPTVVTEPEVLEMSFSRAGLSQGVYYLRLQNTDTGETHRRTFVTVR